MEKVLKVHVDEFNRVHVDDERGNLMVFFPEEKEWALRFINEKLAEKLDGN